VIIIKTMKRKGTEIEGAYRELHKAKDKHGPKAAEIRIGEEPTEQGQQKYGADKVCHYVR
jgi:hypothetical protein